MYNINKIVGYVISPIGCAILGGILAFLCARISRHSFAKWISGMTVVWLWLWMTPLMTWVVGVPLEREFLEEGRVPDVETLPEADAIVLLGGSIGIETNLSNYAEMWTSADRIWQAARLYKAEKSNTIIATGDIAKDSTLGLLRDLGVAIDDVLFMNARNTEDEAKRIAKKGFKKVLLVTSACHMKRARLMFEKYAPDIEVVCSPADFENSMVAARSFSFSDFLPDPGVFMGNSVALHEWVGIVGYRLFR